EKWTLTRENRRWSYRFTGRVEVGSMNTRPPVWGLLLINTLSARNLSTTAFGARCLPPRMLLFKKLITAFLMPMTLGLGTAAVGLVLLWFTRRQRAGRIVVTVGFGLMMLFSYGPVA